MGVVVKVELGVVRVGCDDVSIQQKAKSEKHERS